ncbi:glucosamine 6-phosphate N-acetyltransferase isoform X3 [Trichechus manatus latirostris]|uniref:Glucosamine 6-phosphate N-acetyltransferase n=1 Tax=Trichechus manatus latirostris TaxID=127582 RepID=A0A2Y9QF60_TRIMA|nr:glucosamine 6-phosphate N-acetyltransferase isoform X3 [Trichechus manatus latirostris]
MKPDETPMFDPSLLKEVDWSQNTATFSPAISPTHPGEGLVLRPLCTADLNRGFFKVLGQLTETGVVNPEQFMKSFEHMKKSGDYYVTVVEDVTLGRIVATATLIIEHKFIHSCAKVCIHINDYELDGQVFSSKIDFELPLDKSCYLTALTVKPELY